MNEVDWVHSSMLVRLHTLYCSVIKLLLLLFGNFYYDFENFPNEIDWVHSSQLVRQQFVLSSNYSIVFSTHGVVINVRTSYLRLEAHYTS